MRCLIGLSLLFAAGIQAAVPQLISFQGRLTDAEGNPLDTTVPMTFAIFNDQLGTTQLWKEAHPNVVVRDGMFEVLLGGGTPLSASVLNGSVRYIGMAIDGGDLPDTLIPIVSVAYAMNAASADTAAHAIHARRADTATVALSGGGGGSGGGWVDAGTTVTLENSHDSVGIGTDDPGYPLDVRSSQIAISGKSTGTGLAMGVRGENESSGVGVYGSSSSGSGVYGFSASGKAGWFQGDAYIAGRLGIHTQNPSERLHVYENTNGGGAMTLIQSGHATNWGETGLRIETPQNVWSLRMDSDENTRVPDGGLGLTCTSLSSDVITFTREGRVGINTTEPEYPLDVHSDAVAARGLTTGGAFTAGLYGRAENDGFGVMGSSSSGRGVYGASTSGFGGYFLGPKSYISGNLGVGTENPTHKLTVNGSIGIQSGGETKFHINYYNGGFNISETTVGDYRINIEQGGNVGIGTGNPQARLHVAGDMRVDGKLTADSIFSTSIVDEAGAASVLQSTSGDVTLTTTFQNIVSRQITVPGSGVVLALASLTISLDHDGSNEDLVHVGVSSTSGSVALARRQYCRIGSDVGSGRYNFPLSCQGLFEVAGRGTYTFYLVAAVSSGHSPIEAVHTNLSLIYLPTKYGTVAKSSDLTSTPPEEPLGLEEGSVDDLASDQNDAVSELRALRAELEALKQKIQATEE